MLRNSSVKNLSLLCKWAGGYPHQGLETKSPSCQALQLQTWDGGGAHYGVTVDSVLHYHTDTAGILKTQLTAKEEVRRDKMFAV